MSTKRGAVQNSFFIKIVPEKDEKFRKIYSSIFEDLRENLVRHLLENLEKSTKIR